MNHPDPALTFVCLAVLVVPVALVAIAIRLGEVVKAARDAREARDASKVEERRRLVGRFPGVYERLNRYKALRSDGHI